jgi:hypothetical protein
MAEVTFGGTIQLNDNSRALEENIVVPLKVRINVRCCNIKFAVKKGIVACVNAYMRARVNNGYLLGGGDYHVEEARVRQVELCA